MNVLIACECSGVVRSAFRKAGHNAWSVDLKPDIKDSAYHIQGRVQDTLVAGMRWDLLIAHPPCRYLCSSGLHWNKRVVGRSEKTEQALDFVRFLMSQDIDKICIENPVGCISTCIDARQYGFSNKKASQYIHPYHFGHNASKKTGLWLKGLPKLFYTQVIEPNDNGYYDNQTPSGQNKLGPSAERGALRSVTYTGLASAMVDQWG